MADSIWLEREAARTLTRLMPRIEHLFDDADLYAKFAARMARFFPRAFGHLHAVYGTQYDFFYHLERILTTAAQMFIDRPADLRELDAQREADLDWFLREHMMGATVYVDLFAGNLDGLRERIPYFVEIGLTYLHLMPLFHAPAENSDGGYAISDYRQVTPSLGTMTQLAEIAAELRANGISLVLDFVFNHTSDEHEWALRALNGEEQFQRYYYIFPDRTLPDQYEQNLREIFPEQAPGSFTYRRELNGWVWTTFNSFQWDLNYGNPEVFDAMLGEMLFLANQGTEILRLDAVAFIWKRMGTACENLPEVHDIIRAFNALVQAVAPAMLFKSEAIVHPDDVASYIDVQECPISYNPTFMALIWEALATREVKLLRHSMSKRFDLPARCTWVNYVRVHDDIGWSFADEDAAELGINGFDHRQFLNQFYTGRFPGSFAAGVGFNFNPVTLDMRICGTAASLAGLETALRAGDTTLIEYALRRILMIHSMIIAAGGIPLLYIGDELATLNDYSYERDPAKVEDQRWVHRPRFDWERAEKRLDSSDVVGRVFGSLRHMIETRKATSALADMGRGSTLFFDTGSPHVLGFVRGHRVLVLANFSEHECSLRRDTLAAYWRVPANVVDLLTGEPFSLANLFTLQPYQYLWLTEA